MALIPFMVRKAHHERNQLARVSLAFFDSLGLEKNQGHPNICLQRQSLPTI